MWKLKVESQLPGNKQISPWVSESFGVSHDLSQHLYLYLSGPAVCQRRRSSPYPYRTPEPWDVHPSSTGEDTGRTTTVGRVSFNVRQVLTGVRLAPLDPVPHVLSVLAS